MQCGLLGRYLGHSYSPQIHKMLADYDYQLFQLEPEALESFLQSNSFDGINVTIPYKKAVIPFCDSLTECAEKIGAVNTIIRKSDGSLIGHNTDYYGFQFMLNESKLSIKGKKVLVLGSGGASVTVSAVLKNAGAEVIVISRIGDNNYSNLYLHYDTALIVNTTPVGMYPNTEVSPVDLTHFYALEGVFDLIYNPAKTVLLQMAEEKGVIALNGLLMLVAQAKESAQWFTECSIPDENIFKIHDILLRQMKNIVLIGMPGSGKTTIARALAHEIGKVFVDVDAEIVKEVGMTIPNIFAEYGESGFRDIESRVVSRVCKESNCVIATGGGCIMRDANDPLLKQNGVVFWIQRDVNLLATDGRPLSKTTSLAEMYNIRKPKYEKFCDHRIANDSTVENAVKKILNLLKETS